MANIFQRIFGTQKKELKDKIKDHPNGKHYGCDFGMKNFNKSKRDKSFVEELRKLQSRKPPKGGGGGNEPPPPSSGQCVIFLDFDGHVVSGTSWNVSGDIPCEHSGLTPEEQTQILINVQNHYARFSNVKVTALESDYWAAEVNKRMRVVVTETWEWYGQAGGVAYTNSMFWGDNTPCFVFSSLLGYNLKNISDACSHEAGHTIGLRHQAHWSPECVKLAEYTKELINEESAVMGYPYHAPSNWRIGPNPYGCDQIQDDVAVIASKTQSNV